MRSSVVALSHRLFIVCLFASLSFGCVVGKGEGELSGLVWSTSCDWVAHPYDLRPNHFIADIFQSVDAIFITVQRGSDFRDRSNGLSVRIAHASDFADDAVVEKTLGMEIDLAAQEDIGMNFYVNRDCRDEDEPRINYEAVSGEIRFDALHVPWEDLDAKWIEAELIDVRFEDSANPDERHAVLSGFFRFRYRANTRLP